MVICCTCGSGIGGLWWSELPPTHIHPIPFIQSECGSPFTLLSQGGRVGGGCGRRGRETGVSEGERWSFSPSWPREKEKQLVCKWMPLPCSWMTYPSLPPSHLFIHPFCSLRMFERRDTWRGDLCKNWINNVADSLCCMCVFKIPLLCFVCACVCLCVQNSLSKKKRSPVSSVNFIGHNWQWPLW